MKKVILSALVLIGGIAMGLTKDINLSKSEAPKAKIIVLVNTAQWCPACKANGERVEKNVISSFMSNENYEIVVNDMTNDETSAAGKKMCAKAGITEVATANKGTGVIYFINAESKEVISRISVVESNEKIEAAFKEALTKV